MYYISPQGEYPRHQGDIKIENPTWTQDDALPQGWIEVQDIPRPQPANNETVEEGFPLEVDGTYERNWIVRSMTDEEIARKNAPETAKQKMIDLGFTEAEIEALVQRMVR